MNKDVSLLEPNQLIPYLRQLESTQRESPNIIEYCWQTSKALLDSMFMSPDYFRSLSAYEVKHLNIDYLNHLSKTLFLKIPFQYLNYEQRAGLEYEQLTWLIEARKVTQVVDFISVYKLYYVLATDRQTAPEIFESLTTVKLEQLLELAEKETGLRVKAVMTELFFRSSQWEQLWNKHYPSPTSPCFKRVHCFILEFFHSKERVSAVFGKLDDEMLIQLFKKTHSPEENESLVNLLTIDQLLYLVRTAHKPHTAERLKRGVAGLLIKLPDDKLKALFTQCHKELLLFLFILHLIEKRPDASKIVKNLPHETIIDLFCEAVKSSIQREVDSAIFVLKSCEDHILLESLIEWGNDLVQGPNFFARALAKALPELPEANRTAVMTNAKSMFIIELANGLAVEHPKLLKGYFNFFLENSIADLLLAQADWQVQKQLFLFLLNRKIQLDGLLLKLGNPIKVLSECSQLSPDQMRQLLHGDRSKLKLPLTTYISETDARHPNVMKAAIVIPKRLYMPHDLPATACMFPADELNICLSQASRELKGASPSQEWIEEIADNIFQSDNSLCFAQIRILFKWMQESHPGLLKKYARQNESNKLNLFFCAMKILFLPPKEQPQFLSALDHKIVETRLTRYEVIPKILMIALLLNQKNGDKIIDFIQLLLNTDYKLFEFLPNFDTLSELSESSKEVVHFTFEKIMSSIGNPMEWITQIEKFLESIRLIESEAHNIDSDPQKKIKVDRDYAQILELYSPLIFLADKIKALEPFLKKMKELEARNLLPLCTEAYHRLEIERYDADVWSFLNFAGILLTDNKITLEGVSYVRKIDILGNYISTVADLYRLKLYDPDIKKLLLNLQAFENRNYVSTLLTTEG